MLPASSISNTTIAYLPSINKSSFIIYWAVLLMLICTLISLPFIKTTISVTAQGITRPVHERTEVKSVIGGIIDSIYYHEGDRVNKGATLLMIKDRVTKSKRILNSFKINQIKQFLHDLQLITSNTLNENLIAHLYSPLYKQQLGSFLNQNADQAATVKKAAYELALNTTLLKGKAITQKEFFDVQVQYDKTSSSYKAFVVEQQSNWQQDIARYNLELSQYNDEQSQVNTNASYYAIKAPVSGTLQGINTRYAGGLLQADEVLCTISPDGNLVGECYVTTKDMGLIKLGQASRFQVDAFNYNYFGVLTGKVIAIDNDFTTINNEAIFKVRCIFDQNQVHLKNGFTGRLQKGLTFQVRFIIGERTLWQLLWDKVDDWLNPNAPKQYNVKTTNN